MYKGLRYEGGRYIWSGHWPDRDEAERAAEDELQGGKHAPDGYTPVEKEVKPSASGETFTVNVYCDKK